MGIQHQSLIPFPQERIHHRQILVGGIPGLAGPVQISFRHVFAETVQAAQEHLC